MENDRIDRRDVVCQNHAETTTKIRKDTVTEITQGVSSPSTLSSGDVIFLKLQALLSFLLKSNAELTIPDELTDVRDIVREWTTTRGVLLLTPVFVLPVGATLKFDDSF